MNTNQVTIVGAGLMGHGIAQVFSSHGHRVRLYDPNAEVLASAPGRIVANLQDLGTDPATAQQMAERVSLCDTLEAAVDGSDFVFEAAPERLELKRSIFADLVTVTAEHVVLASNTSVIPISDIANDLQSAARIVGTHWWNPPYLVPLVEVIQGRQTDPAIVDATCDFLRTVGKDPVHVKRDVPGFVGNRLQHALWREAIALVANGICDAETVDRVIKSGFGPRLAVAGPLETADYIGLDLTLDIHEHILADLDVTPGPSPYLRELVEKGHLGMETGQGFRSWVPGDQARLRTKLLEHLAERTEVGS